jgi:sulfur-oxidizing protein SoxA
MTSHTLARTLIALVAVLASAVQAQPPVSGYDYLTPEMQAMQDDDFANPGMIAVDAGETLFFKPGTNGKSCASCHGQGGNALDPARIAGYPVFSEASNKPVTLRGQVIACRNERMDGPPLGYGDRQALELETYVRHLAHGEPVNVDVSGALQSYYTAGEKLYRTRWGQVDIACHQCHDYHAGQTFRGQTLSQGQANGFPVYRFTEGRITGLQERITECLTNLRAEPYPLDSEEYTALEIYMSARSNGLKIEAPGIRY